MSMWPYRRTISSIGPIFSLDHILLITYLIKPLLTHATLVGLHPIWDWPFMSSPCINKLQLCTLTVRPSLASLVSRDHTVSSSSWAARGLSWPPKLVLSSPCLTYDTMKLTAPVFLKGIRKDWPVFVDSWDLKSILPGYSAKQLPEL